MKPPTRTEETVNVKKVSAYVGSAVLLVCLSGIVGGHGVVEIWVVGLVCAGVVLIKDAIVDWKDKTRVRRELKDVEEIAMQSISVEPRVVQSAQMDEEVVEETREDKVEEDQGDREIELQPEISNENLIQPSKTSSKLYQNSKDWIILRVLKRLPWSLIPFCLSMFILTFAFSKVGITSSLARILSNLPANTAIIVFTFGYLATFTSNLMNNIPMTIFFARILSDPVMTARFSPSLIKAAYFGVIIGSNFGANVLFVGSLAGLMWTGLLKDSRYKVSQWEFARVCTGMTILCTGVQCALLVAEIELVGI